MCNQYKIINDMFYFFRTKDSKFSMYFIFPAHHNVNQPHSDAEQQHVHKCYCPGSDDLENFLILINV